MKSADIKHETLKTYIEGDHSIVSEGQRQENNQLRLLLDLVDQALSLEALPAKSNASETQFTFEQTENILSDILAGTDSKTSKQNFLAALYYSSDFYQRVMIKLDELVPVMEGTLDEELLEVAVKEDEQVLKELGLGNSDLSGSQEKPMASGIVERLIGWMIPKKRYAYVMALWILGLIIILPGSFVVYHAIQDYQSQDILTEFVYEDKVPYEYTQSSLRGADFIENTDSLLILFDRKFKLAIGEYLLTEYEQAVTMFNQMENLSNDILKRDINKANITLIRDFFLYRGLSEYALGMSADLSANDKNMARLNSISHLNKGFSFATEHNLPRRDVENYFLGILHYLNNDKQSAIRHLSEISDQSEFYRDAQILLISLKSH